MNGQKGVKAAQTVKIIVISLGLRHRVECLDIKNFYYSSQCFSEIILRGEYLKDYLRTIRVGFENRYELRSL